MHIRRFIGDIALAATGLLILVCVLVLFDNRFREQLAFTVSSSPSGEVVGLGQQVTDLALASALLMGQFARQQMVEHAHLTVFAGAAFVLVIALLRL